MTGTLLCVPAANIVRGWAGITYPSTCGPTARPHVNSGVRFRLNQSGNNPRMTPSVLTKLWTDAARRQATLSGAVSQPICCICTAPCVCRYVTEGCSQNPLSMITEEKYGLLSAGSFASGEARTSQTDT